MHNKTDRNIDRKVSLYANNFCSFRGERRLPKDDDDKNPQDAAAAAAVLEVE